jgi:hypothetical protein
VSTDKKQARKLAHVEATFPEIREALSLRSGRGEGSTSKAAISRAIGDLLKKRKGRHVTTFSCRVTMVTRPRTV